ncbi:uncharacterized protein PgNI_07807 [Pyricularia grisea]|uniref:Uncharacterized protein n=1 Tax=Pyricularia grisea TaxID=148305 RepID=A0A6P8B2G6_PYRGI|nr:uncharacterized protein PgNI_07807 [Pyricularia grisea]TLD09046.1 hypothetical protein PgNI_07807 [Pyricularia grisea]
MALQDDYFHAQIPSRAFEQLPEDDKPSSTTSADHAADQPIPNCDGISNTYRKILASMSRFVISILNYGSIPNSSGSDLADPCRVLRDYFCFVFT